MKLKLIFILLAACVITNAQAPDRFYSKFGGAGDDIGYSGKQALDKQYIIVGSSSSSGNGSTDVYLAKVDTMGNLLWENFYGGSGNEVGRSIVLLPDSGFVITGFTSSYGAGGYDCFTLRTDKKGNLLWQKTFGGTDWDFASDIVLASDGKLIIVGNTTSYGNGKKDGFIIKYDLDGNEIWRKFIGGVENDELKSAIKTNDNNIAVTGYTESRGDVNGDIYFVKYNLNGDTLFTKLYGGLYKDSGTDLIQKPNGDYILCGAKTFSLNAKSESYIISVNSAGNYIWDNHYYNSSGNETYVSLADSYSPLDKTTYLRNVPVSGFKTQGNLMVASQGGWALSVNSFGGTEEEEFFSVEPTIDKGYLSIGWTTSFDGLNKDVIIMKNDSTVQNYQSVVGINKVTATNELSILRDAGNNTKIIFTGEQNVIGLTLLNINGETVKKFDNTEKQQIFEIRNNELASGVYILCYTMANRQSNFRKLIIE